MTNKKALFIIVNAGFAEQAVDVATSCGARGATIMPARGTGAKYTTFLGIAYEPAKEIIISVLDESVAHSVMEAIAKKIGKETPTGGICFMLPVDASTMLS